MKIEFHNHISELQEYHHENATKLHTLQNSFLSKGHIGLRQCQYRNKKYVTLALYPPSVESYGF